MGLNDVIWRHQKTGGLYWIEGFAIEEATLTPVVIYRKVEVEVGGTFTRPCEEFFDGRYVQQSVEITHLRPRE